ncbi:MAG TPA: hypothetical protein VJT67_01710 [Longimicrobiaceae bacterium]|nr:hypothetical protein [Longimicrobiaceae bacterium]
MGSTVDGNGFFVNPRWVVQDRVPLPNVDSLCGEFQQREAGRPRFLNDCTNHLPPQIAFVEPQIRIGKLCKGAVGHVNWRVASNRPANQSAATVSGRLFVADEGLFLGIIGGGVGQVDGDIAMFLQTPGDPGRTVRNPHVKNGTAATGSAVLELEFRLAELRRKWRQEFWLALRDDVAVNSGAIHSRFDGRLAVAVGIFGVDGVHDAHSEIHPVMALAVRTDVRGNTDTWELFARNWGDEGMCGQEEQRLDLPKDTLYLWLPPRPGATSARIEFNGLRELSPDTFQANAIAFPIPLGRPERHEVVDGTLTVKWLGRPERVVHEPAPRPGFDHLTESDEAMASRTLSAEQRERMRRILFASPTEENQARMMERNKGLGAQAPQRVPWEASGKAVDSVWITAICRMKRDTIPDAGRCPRPYRQ